MDALSVLTSLAIVLLAGIIITIIAKNLKISSPLLLIILGIILKSIKFQEEPVFEFSSTFLIGISVLALVMITFDGSSKFKFKEIDKFSGDAIRVVGWFLLTNMILLSIFTNLMFFHAFTLEFIIFSVVFAFIMSGTDPGAVFYIMGDKVTKVIEVLKIESIINTPVIVLLPFILLDFLSASGGGNQLFQSFLSQITPFLQQIIVGIGAGVIVGIVMFKAIKYMYQFKLGPLSIITAALLSYIIAENMGGNGVLSVATMGLFFGNLYLEKRIDLQEFSSIFSEGLMILVFVLVGFIVTIELSAVFILKSFGLFLILIVSRWIAVNIALKKTDFRFREKLFMTLNIPKGIAVAAVVFSLTVREIVGLGIVIDLVLVFTIYSLILSTIITPYAKKFLAKPEPQVNVDIQTSEAENPKIEPEIIEPVSEEASKKSGFFKK